MAVSARFEQLSEKHSTLETQIRQEMRSPMPDTLRLSSLKKQKLHIKDALRGFADSA